MEDWSRIIAASVVPIVIISACGLLCLAFYNRLAAIVARLRTFQRERLKEQELLSSSVSAAETDPAVLERHQRLLRLLEEQTLDVTRRAHLVQNTLLGLLTAIACLIVCSLLIGLSLLIPVFAQLAVVFFVVGMLAMLAGVLCAISELRAALGPIEQESQTVTHLYPSEDAGV